MKALPAVVAASVLAIAAPAFSAQSPMPLRVSDNQRFLQHADGRPFFWLADTCWELFHRCTREDAALLLEDRAKKGFTVIQAVVLAEEDGLHDPNLYGHRPLDGDDPTKPNEAYFAHVDWIVAKANSLGLVVGMLPTWGDKYHRGGGKGPEIFTPQNARTYGEWLARRYAKSDIIWIVGGDRQLTTENHVLVNRALAEGIRAAVGRTQLITFHPPGQKSSSLYVHAESWLDFHMIQSGHRRDKDNYEMIAHDYALMPRRPVVDGEPGYEDHPNFFNPNRGWLDEHDVRKSCYWALFAGSLGYTYGCHDIWMFCTPEKGWVKSWSRTPWREALKFPGSAQVGHARRLMESRPFLTRMPDQSLIVGDAWVGTGDHLRATRDEAKSYAMLYVPSGQHVKVNLTLLAGDKVRAWWFNPRDGAATLIGELEKKPDAEFKPPYDARGRDWVFVLDDAAKNFPAPGSKM